MNILIDLLLMIIVIAIICALSGKSILRATAGFVALVLALICSWMLTELAVPAASSLIEKPLVHDVAGRIADIAQTPRLNQAKETLAQIDLTSLLENYTIEMQALAGQYDVPITELSAAETTEELADILVAPLAGSIAYAVLYVIIFVVLYFLFHAVLNFILFKSVSREHLKRKFNIFSFIVGCVAAFLFVVFCVQPVIEQLRPYTIGVLKVIQLDQACTHSTLYGWFQYCNFLKR